MTTTVKSPYQVIKAPYTTEKTRWMTELQAYEGKTNWTKFEQPIYTFIVDPAANKQEIRWAIETIYKEKNVKVTKVNVINGKSKPRRYRGRRGKTATYKKAMVWLEKGDDLEDV